MGGNQEGNCGGFPMRIRVMVFRGFFTFTSYGYHIIEQIHHTLPFLETPPSLLVLRLSE